MKNLRKWKRMMISVCLCIAILTSGMPLTAQAQVIAEEREELAVPTEFPAKGTLHMQIQTEKRITSEGETVYLHKEAYLPVLVDQNKRVYGELDTLAAHLAMELKYYGSSAWISYYDTNIYLALNDATAGYQNSLFSVIVNMGQAPVIFEDTWYVPLDAFLQLTDSFGFYGDENWLGKKELYVIPPQRTVLDEIADFYENAYSDYAFSYMKDLGYTEDQAAKMAGTAAAVQYIHGVGSLDRDAWIAIAFGGYTTKAIDHFNTKYVDKYMAYLLQSNEEMVSKLVDGTKETIDYAGFYMELASLGKKADFSSSIVNVNIGGKTFAAWFADLQRGIEVGKVAGMGMNYLLSFASLYLNFKNSDQWCLEAAKAFYNNRPIAEHQIINETDFWAVKRNIDNYSGFIVQSITDEWLRENWMKLLVDATSLAEVAHMDVVGTVSALWSGGTKIIFHKGLDATENYLSGMFGIQYEAEAVEAAMEKIRRCITDSTGRSSLSSNVETELRQAVYHAVKACYVARYLGCLGYEKLFDNYPELLSGQESYNQRLSQIGASMMNMNMAFGRLPQDLVSIHVQEYDHFSNVIFNICQISGYVLSWDDEQPLKGVKVEVVGDDGTTLAEFETDEEGWFDQSFQLNDVDPNQPTPLQKVLTLHLTYKRNPVVLEYIQIQCFKSYLVEGLHAGKKTEEIMAYLNGARDEGGRTILDISRITLDEETVWFDMPDWNDGTYKAYTVLPGQMEMATDMESVQLGDKVTFETLYTRMMPEGSFAGGMARLFAQADDSFPMPAALLKTELHDAADIQSFVDAYVEINGEYPAFQIKKVNSLVDSMEPIAVIRGN